MAQVQLTTAQRGYGRDHQKDRAWWAPHVAAGVIYCWRCGKLINPRPWMIGAGWDLGHDDHDRTVHRGPEHIECNRAAGARKGNRLRRLSMRRSRIW